MDRLLVVAALLGAVVALWLFLRARNAGARPPERVRPADFGLDGEEGRAVILFTSPYCQACRHWTEALSTRGVAYLRFDVKARPDLARRYRVRATPLVLAVEQSNGRVVASDRDEPTPEGVDRIAAAV